MAIQTKTLECLPNYPSVSESNKFKLCVEVDQLRQEAVNWILSLKSVVDENGDGTYELPYGYLINDEFMECEGSREISVLVDWIMHFFNITEKDLVQK